MINNNLLNKIDINTIYDFLNKQTSTAGLCLYKYCSLKYTCNHFPLVCSHTVNIKLNRVSFLSQ